MENELINSLIISTKNLVEKEVDKEIEQEVNKFRQELEARRDNYVAEIMKGIKFAHQFNNTDYCMEYKIIVENVTKIERREDARN